MKSNTPFDLGGKNALVTGAGSGLGQSIAQGLAAHGAQVLATDINGNTAKQTADMINTAGGKASALEVDITSQQDVDRMVARAIETFQRLDISFNVPGINIRKPALELSDSECQRVMDVNVTGIFRCAKAVGKVMVEQRGGSMIIVSSIMATVVVPKNVWYCATKGGTLQMSKGLAVEWAPYNVRVNALAPGYMRTPLLRQVLEDPDWLADIERRTPLGRLGNPEEIIGPAVFLASDASSYVTGAVLFVDGGWTAW